MLIELQNYRKLLRSVAAFAAGGSGLRLRSYQRRVARAIVDSVLNCRGCSFVVIFPRQSGKNELQAQIEAYLLLLLSQSGAEMVKVSPTWKPQSQNAMRRLERTLKRNILTRDLWSKESGYIYKIGLASITFLSGSPTSNVVGATASTLLECDEAQDVMIDKWDKEINPMAASTNATRVYWGTAWTARTLLAREKLLALEAERRDGCQRVFQLTADEVGQEVPAYRRFVEGEIARLGRGHPFVLTQYFSKEIDVEAGMFMPDRLALMMGDHPPLDSPSPFEWGATPIGEGRGGGPFAFLIDIAGQDEGRLGGDGQLALFSMPGLSNPGRDATALTVVQVDLGQLETLRAPVYRVVHRYAWVGVRHTLLYAQINAYVEAWQPAYIVCDATGVGAGLVSFLEGAYRRRVLPFVFTQASKSKLGWDFIAICESGRFKEYRGYDRLHQEFIRQLEHTTLEALPGPGRTIRWGVPQGERDPASGDLIHDDLVVSAALCALLDEQTWGAARSATIQPPDPLEGLGDVF